MFVLPLAAATLLMLSQEIIRTTPEGAPLNPALIEQHPERYLERDVELTGSLYECDGEWCLTDIRIQAPNALRLRFATSALIKPFANTSYVPERLGPFLYSRGCLVHVVGLLLTEYGPKNRYFLLAVALSPDQDHAR